MKRMATLWLAVLVVPLGLGLAFCGDDDGDNQQDAAVDARVLADRYIPDAGDAGPATASIFGIVDDIIDYEQVPGAVACWDPDGLNICGTANGMGRVTLQGLPPETAGLVVVNGVDLLDNIHAIFTPPGMIESGFPVVDASGLAFVYTTGDASVTAGMGTLFIEAVRTVINPGGEERVESVPNATFSITGGTADGPHYIAGDPRNGIDSNLSATGGSGIGVFLNATPGSYSVSISDGGANCRLGRYSDVEGPATAPIEAGKVTWAGFWCDAP